MTKRGERKGKREKAKGKRQKGKKAKGKKGEQNSFYPGGNRTAEN
jgi:hypothetical protein